MRNIMPLPIVGIVLLTIALIIIIPILIKVNVSLNITKKCIDIVVKLFGFITVININLCINDVFLVASTKRKVKKLPLWEISLKPPKGLYLIKALKLIKVNTLYNINVYTLTKNNVFTYFLVSSMYTAEGVLLGNGIDSKSNLNISSKNSTLSIDFFITVTIYRLIKIMIKEGLYGRARSKPNTANS